MFRVVILGSLIILASCSSKAKSKTIAHSIDAQISYDKIDKVPIALTYNTALELNFMETSNTNQTTFVVSEVIITSHRWASTFSEAGNIIARSREATVIAIKDGECYLQEMIFKQKASGNGFKKTVITKKKGWKTFDCSLMENKNPSNIARVKFVE